MSNLLQLFSLLNYRKYHKVIQSSCQCPLKMSTQIFYQSARAQRWHFRSVYEM